MRDVEETVQLWFLSLTARYILRSLSPDIHPHNNHLQSHVSSSIFRCANISFTKNPEKYHKYRPEEVEEMIEKLFDTSA